MEVDVDMVDNDIYNNKQYWDNFVERVDQLIIPPERRTKNYRSKYYIKNPKNLGYFKKLIQKFEAQDLSYIRRRRMRDIFLFVCYHTENDLKSLDEDDIERIAIEMFKTHTTIASQSSFISMARRIWKILFKNSKYWAEIKARQDRSKQRQRKDKISPEEYKAIFNYFNRDIEMKLIVSLVVESLCRPAELVSCKISGIEDYNDYALINTERGKEGIKKLICIDSYAFLKEYLKNHPLKDNKDSYLFTNYYRMIDSNIHPKYINQRLRRACNDLKLGKTITLYSLKRFGVTSKRLQGYTDNEIIKTAGWTSGKQLATYDLSTQQEVIDSLLAKKGIRKDDENYNILQKKSCIYCGKGDIDFNEDDCPNCRRSLDIGKIRKQMEIMEKIQNLPEIEKILEQLNSFKNKMDGVGNV